MIVFARNHADSSTNFYFPPEEIADKVRLSKNSSSSRMYAPLSLSRTVFIAGNHDLATEERIQRLFSPLYARVVTSTSEKRKHQLSETQGAALDQFVCLRAVVFIGNNKSGWSGVTAQLREARGARGSNFMVNFSPEGKSKHLPTHVLEPFRHPSQNA